MSGKAPFEENLQSDPSQRKLIRRVVRGDAEAWKEFVETITNLLYRFVWRYSCGDSDLSADLYLYVVDGLQQANEKGEQHYRLRRYLQSLKSYQGRARLSTWLGKVTQNLVSDYFRQQDGRRTLPRAVARMDQARQQAFKLLYWECQGERDSFEVLRGKGLVANRTAFDEMVVEINGQLKTCNRWSLYCEVIRKTPALPLHPFPPTAESVNRVQVADPDPASVPIHSAITEQERRQASSMAEVLRKLIAALDQDSRRLLVCRFKHGMTAGEIAKLLGIAPPKRVYTELERLRANLKTALRKAGFDWEALAGGLDTLEGLLDEFDDPQKNRSGKKYEK